MFRVKLPRGQIRGATAFNKWTDKIVTSLENLWNFSATGNVSVTVDPKTGIHIHVPDFPIAIFKSTNTSTVRSGATPGFVTADFQMFNGTSFVGDAARTAQKVFIFSGSANTIASGKYGIAIKVFGYWFCVAVEC